MVLITFRSLNSSRSQSIFKLFRFNRRDRFFKRNVASNITSQEFAEQQSSIDVERKPSKPPFVKQLFLGVYDKDVLIYPEIFSLEHFDRINNSLEPIKQYFKDNVNSKDIDANAKLPGEVMEELKKLSLWGLRIPKEYGGQGTNATEYACFSEVTARDSSVSLLLAAHQSIAVQSILLAGSEEQKQKYLPKLASGEWLATFCISENVSGSDVASIETTAEYDEKNDSWVLNGKKLWVTNGINANIFIVLSVSIHKNQFGDTRSVSAFIVEKDFSGVTVSDTIKMIGARGASVNEVKLSDVVIPGGNLLGEKGSGFQLAIDMLSSNRFTAGANTIAMLKQLLGEVVEHIIHRKQFGTKLMDCEKIQKQCAQVALNIYALESMTYMTTGLHDQFEKYDGSLENAVVKAFAMEYGQKSIDICLDLLGAQSCMEDFPYERYARDFKTMSLFDGALDFTKLYICSMGLHHACQAVSEDVKKIRNPFNYSGYVFKRILSDRRNVNDDPKLTLELYLQLHASLSTAAKQLEYCVFRLHYGVNCILRNHGKYVMSHQLDLLRIASVVVDVYAMTAVLGRASRAYCTGLAHADSEVILAQKYCNDGFQRVKKNVNDIAEGADGNGDVYYFKIAEDVFTSHGYCFEHPTKRNI